MFRSFAATAALAVLAACNPQASDAPLPVQNEPETSAADPREVLHVYSARNYESDKVLYARFEEETGVRVDVRESGAPELMDALKAEGADSPADVLLIADAGTLYQFQQAGFTQPVRSEVLEKTIPEHLRERDGNWFGLAKRARVIVYDPQLLPLEEVDTYADLANDRLKGELCVRSGTHIYNLSLLSELISRIGSDAAEAWASGAASNFARTPEGGDMAQIEAVAAGKCAAALVNHYYWVRLATGSTEERLTAAKTLVSFPDQDGAGTHINITGAAVASATDSQDLAVRFIEFLATPEGQILLISGTGEYPVVAGAALPEGLDLLASFKQSDFSLSMLGANLAEAQAIYDRAGWD